DQLPAVLLRGPDQRDDRLPQSGAAEGHHHLRVLRGGGARAVLGHALVVGGDLPGALLGQRDAFIAQRGLGGQRRGLGIGIGAGAWVCGGGADGSAGGGAGAGAMCRAVADTWEEPGAIAAPDASEASRAPSIAALVQDRYGAAGADRASTSRHCLLGLEALGF